MTKGEVVTTKWTPRLSVDEKRFPKMEGFRDKEVERVGDTLCTFSLDVFLADPSASRDALEAARRRARYLRSSVAPAASAAAAGTHHPSPPSSPSRAGIPAPTAFWQSVVAARQGKKKP
jgi:hypothetical protein